VWGRNEKKKFCVLSIRMKIDKADKSKEKIKALLRDYNTVIEDFAKTNYQSINRENLHVFVRDPPLGEENDGNGSGRKRKAHDIPTDPACNACRPEFWLAGINMRIGKVWT